MSTTPGGRDGPETAQQGLNSMRRFLTGMARDVPKQLRRSAAVRRQLRRGKR